MLIDKFINKNSVLRSAQNTRQYIMKQDDPRAAANAIIREFGVEQSVNNLYDARITAMNMVGDYIRFGSEFDHNESFQHGLRRAEMMRSQYPSFAKEEDNMDAVIDNVDNVKVEKAPKAVKPKKSVEEIALQKAQRKVVKNVAKAKAVDSTEAAAPKTGKVKGSMREVTRKICLDNKLSDRAVVIQLVAEALQISKSGAYAHVYNAMKDLKKNNLI